MFYLSQFRKLMLWVSCLLTPFFLEGSFYFGLIFCFGRWGRASIFLVISSTELRKFSTSAAEQKYCWILSSERPICLNNIFKNLTCSYVFKFPFPNSHSPSFQEIIATPSAPFKKHSIIKWIPILPVHLTLIRWRLLEYDFLVVPVKSATEYPHLSHPKAIIFFSFTLFDIYSRQ